MRVNTLAGSQRFFPAWEMDAVYGCVGIRTERVTPPVTTVDLGAEKPFLGTAMIAPHIHLVNAGYGAYAAKGAQDQGVEILVIGKQQQGRVVAKLQQGILALPRVRGGLGLGVVAVSGRFHSSTSS